MHFVIMRYFFQDGFKIVHLTGCLLLIIAIAVRWDYDTTAKSWG
jgi:hypothetical protein